MDSSNTDFGEPPKGITTWVTEDGIRVLRIHYSADPGKDPETDAGKRWLDEYLKGYIGGIKGKDWKSEMDIDFSVFRGKAVYPTFSSELHIASRQLDPIRGVPIIRGWDFGLTPACTFSQLTPSSRWLIFPCLHTTDREGIGITTFGQEVVEYSNLTYQGFKFVDYGDPAAFQRSQVDERTCAMVLSSMGVNLMPGDVGSRSRDDIVRVQLERLVNGVPFVQVCPTASFMIQGFAGGFQYQEIGKTGIFTEEHAKNAFSHAHEGLQYAASRMFKSSDPQGRHGTMGSMNGRRKAQHGFSNWANKPTNWA